MTARRFSLWLGLLTLAALALRLVYLWHGPDTSVSGDGSYFYLGALDLADGKGFVDPYGAFLGAHLPGADHPPGWTTRLSIPSLLGIRSRPSHQVFACFVGASGVLVIGCAGRRLGGPRVGLIAAAIAAVYANFWMYEKPLLSETFVVVAVATTILLALRFRDDPGFGRAAALGAACGALTLVRAEQVLLLAVLVVPLALFADAVPWRRRLEWLAVSVGVGVLVLSPWLVYNATRYQEPTLLTTNFGGALAIANCDAVYHGANIGFWEDRCYRFESTLGVVNPMGVPGALVQRHEDGSTLDAERRDLGLDYARAHLGDLPRVVAAREGRTWGLFRPFQQLQLDLVSGSIWPLQLGLWSYWVLAAFGVGGAVVLRRRPLTLWVLASFIVVVFITTAVTFGQTRYRVPADVAIVLLAAVGVDRVIPRPSAERGPDAPPGPPSAAGARRRRRARLPSVHSS
jgi:4-amino-4-deoxy-L-arabinose transferase-like glycosyltransferase